MNEGLLPQKCDIMKIVEVTDEYETRHEPAVVYKDVPCRLDTLIMSRIGTDPNPGMTSARAGGLLFVNHNSARFGTYRNWDEDNFVRLNGIDYTINFIHDVWGGAIIDHYEVEVQRGIHR